MRLIDADKLIGFIDKGKYCNPNSLQFSENDVCEMIEQQPTAYDVDKVIEELTDNAIDETGIDYEMDISLDDAIDIVKRGGVE